MINNIRISGLYVLDQDEALDFYVGKLGLEVHTDADLGFMRWLTVCVPGEPGREILLERPGPPAMDDGTAEQVREVLTKGSAGAAGSASPPTTAARPTRSCRRAGSSSPRSRPSATTGSTARCATRSATRSGSRSRPRAAEVERADVGGRRVGPAPDVQRTSSDVADTVAAQRVPRPGGQTAVADRQNRVVEGIQS